MKQLSPVLETDRLIHLDEQDGRLRYLLYHRHWPIGMTDTAKWYGNRLYYPGVWLLLRRDDQPRFKVFLNILNEENNFRLAQMLAEFSSCKRAYGPADLIEYEFTIPDEFVHFRLRWERM